MRQLVTLGLEELSASTVHTQRHTQPQGPHRTTRAGSGGVVIELSRYKITHEAGDQATARCDPMGFWEDLRCGVGVSGHNTQSECLMLYLPLSNPKDSHPNKEVGKRPLCPSSWERTLCRASHPVTSSHSQPLPPGSQFALRSSALSRHVKATGTMHKSIALWRDFSKLLPSFWLCMTHFHIRGP